MFGKLGFLLLFLQMWQFATPNQIMQELSQINESNQTDLIVTPVAGTETNFPIQIGRKFYHIDTNEEVNWYQAEANCRQLGGYLLNIESSEEMDALLSVIPESRFWTSANCLAKDREFISVATGEKMPYLRWLEGEPNNENGIEYCVEIKRTALNDQSCPTILHYICEAKII